MDRGDIGGWLSGPRTTSPADDDAAPGQRLGLPLSGRGSVAGWGQRFGAVFIDWFVALGVSMAIAGPPEPGNKGLNVVTLAVFAMEYVVLLLAAGRTIGMAVAGFQVLPIGRARLGLLPVLVRTALLVLVVPAVIYDRDRRGLHDRAARTVTVRSR